MRRWAYIAAAVALVTVCSSCSLLHMEDKFVARPASYQQLQGWEYDKHAEALVVFVKSCVRLSEKPRNISAGSGIEISSDVWRSLCQEAGTITPGDNLAARRFFERNFVPYQVANNSQKEGLFTGYYEPLLYGSLTRKGYFQFPIYKPPAELGTSKPYYTHAQINRGALKGKELELLWVDDPVMLFFLHVQGSGRIMLDDGRVVYVGYADKNGQAYHSIGKYMIDNNLMKKDDVNFFTLRQWLYAHKEHAFDVMEHNPSYVFFDIREQGGPIGASGTVLTPERSLAVDSHYIPYGLPVFLQTALPEPSGNVRPFHRLMVAQDTGGAIRGPVRGDIFFGYGQEAEYLAGYMKGYGQYALLVPRDIEYQLQ